MKCVEFRCNSKQMHSGDKDLGDEIDHMNQFDLRRVQSLKGNVDVNQAHGIEGHWFCCFSFSSCFSFLVKSSLGQNSCQPT